MSRREARSHAFCLIYQFPFMVPLDAKAVAEAMVYYYDGLEKRPSRLDIAYVNRAVSGAQERLVQLDGVISHFLKDWDIQRLNRVDLALLRLAIYEILCEPDVPPGVATNEAVMLAKEFGTDESPAFINGVLGNIVRARGLDAKDSKQEEEQLV